jgi:cation:H+ antiporter
MILSFVLLILGFAMLILGADWLVDGACSIARHINMPATLIGLTVVALGTSTPEMFINVSSSIKGLPDMVMGNVIGSNLFDLLVVLGLTALFHPLDGHKGTTWRELPFLLIVSVILLFLSNDMWLMSNSLNMLRRMDGLVLLLLFALFIIYTNHLNHRTPKGSDEITMYPLLLTLAMVLGGLLLLYFGSDWVVKNAVKIAHNWGMTEKTISLTVVALGTSLPELATSVIAAVKKRPEIAIGNIVGSSVYNVLLILGISSLIRPIPYNIAFNTDMFFMLGGIVLLFGFMFIGRKHSLNRWQGAALVALYAVYLVLMFTRH